MTLDTKTIEEYIQQGESLRVEFKGESHAATSDRDIYEVIVCLANGEGGVLLIGVEDDGTVTGTHPRHGTSTDPHRLQAAIFNNTVPSINTRVSLHTIQGQSVIAIEVDQYPVVCSTKEGKSIRRVLGMAGPECLPFYPHEHPSRHSDLGLVDQSAQFLEGATWEDLDPIEIVRLRETIRRLGGSTTLLALEERQLVQALQLVETRNGELTPNVAGMLLLGREEAITQFLPTHQVAFQVLDAKGNVLVNDWFRGPLLKTLEAIEERFNARNQEQEVQVGLVRLPVPDYDKDAFREALNNAVSHRDYTRLGAVHVQMHPNYLHMTNPGGFLEGITLGNLLVHEPKPRNPRLAEVFRRINLVETTGRGIDKIYMGQLRYGRSLPDYTQSNRDAIRLLLSSDEASLEFAAFVYNEARAERPLSLDDLLILNHLRKEKRIDVELAGQLTQRGKIYAQSVLDRLSGRGFIEERNERKERVYYLTTQLHRQIGLVSRLLRPSLAEQEEMVLRYVDQYGQITRREILEILNISERQARSLLRRLTTNNRLKLQSLGRSAYYIRP